MASPSTVFRLITEPEWLVRWVGGLHGLELSALESPGGQASIEMTERGEAELALTRAAILQQSLDARIAELDRAAFGEDPRCDAS